VDILIIVNASPWGSTLAVTAWRFAQAAVADGDRLLAVYFQGEGVYNALAGSQADAGTPEMAAAWQVLAEQSGTELLLCSAAAGRRLGAANGVQQPAAFSSAGLASLLERMQHCDRVVSF
jgi:tRNA 2-thiouridine synthesizing protein D